MRPNPENQLNEASHQTTVELHDGILLTVRRLTTREFHELFQVVLKNRTDENCPFIPDSIDEGLHYIPLLVSRATGKSREWMTERPGSDLEALYQALIALHSGDIAILRANQKSPQTPKRN